MDYEVKDFSKDVLQASFTKPVLVDFWAKWCAPCRILGPVLERLASSSDDWTLVKVNSDEHPELSAKYGIRSIPNVKLFSKGEVINEFVGALPEHAVKQWLTKNLPNKYDSLLNDVESLINSKQITKARQILEQIIKNDKNNLQAKIKLASLILFDEPDNALTLVSDIEEPNEFEEKLNAVKTIASIIRSNDHNPNENSDTVKIYMTALEQLRNKQFDLALENFIEIIKQDRFFKEDIARKVCIAIFKYLGEEDPISLKYRREFGRALYV